jgi:hypothetical protein
MSICVTIREAAEITGRSKQTIRRWRAEGVKVDDPQSLLEHSEWMDMRSRGRAANLAFDRPGATAPQSAGNFPGDAKGARHALSVLEGLKASFGNRLDKAKKIGDELETGMLEEELRMLSESGRLLAAVMEAYLV